uniref:Uncharacterized protein n=1 Tax=Panstrongylus lignarius TaxID=156445 RepID=A0A224XAS0_9HEMI
MITLIKLLVLLFLSVLGYDTLNLFLQRTYNNEDRDLATVTKTEEPNLSYTPLYENYSIGNKNLLIFIISLGVIALIFLLFRKRHREEGTRIAEIVSQLKTISECSKTLDKLNLNYENKNDLIDEINNDHQNEYNFSEEIHSAITSRNPSPDGSKSSDDSDIEQLQQRNKFLVSKSKSATPVFVLPNENFNLFEDINDLGEQKISLANNTQENYFFNYESFNNPRHLFYSESMPMKYMLPEMNNQVTRNCDCNITQFEERLEEVECNLRSTREVTILWRNRIEQTEEELLELQQQINAMLLEITHSKIRTLDGKRNRNELLDYSLLFPSLGAFKPLQIISDLIEETKKQMEEEQRHEKEKVEASAEEASKFSQKIGGCLIISNENIVKEEKLSDANNQNVISATEPEPSKDQEKEKCCKSDKEEAVVLENEKSEKLPPSEAEEMKNLQLQEPSTQETQTETISFVTETIFEYDFTTQAKKARFKEITPRVPSHIVQPAYQAKKSRRPPPRCAYSVLTEQGKYCA